MKTRLPARGFWSYARKDDDYSDRRVSQLYDKIRKEVELDYGRPVDIFQDTSIKKGARWEAGIKDAIANSAFLIPVITPTFLQRPWCFKEVTLFLKREKELQARHPELRKESLIFPIGYREIRDDEALEPHLIAMLRGRQWVKLEEWLDLDLQDHRILSEIRELVSGVSRLLRISVEAEEERRAPAADAFTPVNQPSPGKAGTVAIPEPLKDEPALGEAWQNPETQAGRPSAAPGGKRKSSGQVLPRAVAFLRRRPLPATMIALLVLAGLAFWISPALLDRQGPAVPVAQGRDAPQPAVPGIAKGETAAAGERQAPSATARGSQPPPGRRIPDPTPLNPAQRQQLVPGLALTTIQVGVFTSEAAAENAWRELAGRFPYLAPLSHSVVRYTSSGRTLYRLLATGSAAAEVCRRMDAAGHACLVIPPRLSRHERMAARV